KLVCPVSQKRVLLKCGNMDSGSGRPALGSEVGSTGSVAAGVAFWLETEADGACVCAQPTEAAAANTTGSSRSMAGMGEAMRPPSGRARRPSLHRVTALFES